MPVSQPGEPKYKINIQMAANNAQPGDRPVDSWYRVGPDYSDKQLAMAEFARFQLKGIPVRMVKEEVVMTYR